MSICRIAALTLFFFTRLALADYAWIPDEQKLFLKIGGDFYTSAQNFLTDGSKGDLVYQGQLVRLNDWRFWVEPEYGIAKDFSVKLHTGFITNSISSQAGTGTILSGSGAGDIWTSAKWRVKSDLPIITLELAVKIPTYSMTPSAADQLVLGDGDFDLGFYLHLGHQSGPVVFALSPGFLARFSGYSPAFVVDGAIEYRFPRGYLRALASAIVSIGNNLLFDTGSAIHDAPGAGDSYARLSGSPNGFYAGGRAGIVAVPGMVVEAGVNQSLSGSRYPVFTQVTFDVFFAMDFFQPDTVHKRLKEVPLDEKPPPFYEKR